jgi:hypothetical protein
LEHPGERLGPAFLDVAGRGDGLVVVAGGSRVVLLAGHVPGEPAQQRGGLHLNPPQFLVDAAKGGLLTQQRDLLQPLGRLGQ